QPLSVHYLRRPLQLDCPFDSDPRRLDRRQVHPARLVARASRPCCVTNSQASLNQGPPTGGTPVPHVIHGRDARATRHPRAGRPCHTSSTGGTPVPPPPTGGTPVPPPPTGGTPVPPPPTGGTPVPPPPTGGTPVPRVTLPEKRGARYRRVPSSSDPALPALAVESPRT